MINIGEILTCCLDKPRVMLGCQEGVGELSEELLQKSSNAIDIMEEALWVAEIHF